METTQQLLDDDAIPYDYGRSIWEAIVPVSLSAPRPRRDLADRPGHVPATWPITPIDGDDAVEYDPGAVFRNIPPLTWDEAAIARVLARMQEQQAAPVSTVRPIHGTEPKAATPRKRRRDYAFVR
jgi:hypothetical protein